MVEVAAKPIESHKTHSERLIEHAEEQLAKGDRLQASEKAWGAVAHQLKVVAAQRAWEYKLHSQAYGIIEKLSKELKSDRLLELFPVANNLHQNFYADTKPIEQIRGEIKQVKELLSLLEYAELRGLKKPPNVPKNPPVKPRTPRARRPRSRRL